MNSKWLLGLIALLVISNSYFVIKAIQYDGKKQGVTLATVGTVDISEARLIEQLKKQHGQKVLKDIINKEVVFQLAKKQGIKLSAAVIEQEINFVKTMYSNSIHQSENITFDDDLIKEDVMYVLLLEEIYTRDIVISEEELINFYNENKEFYNSQDTYLVSHIVVPTLEEIDQVVEELSAGSSFSVLAMEKSVDMVTASEGGNIGYIQSDSSHVPTQYFQEVEKLEVGQWSEPIKLEDEYAVILLKEKIAGRTYTFEQLKGQIRRQLALQQLDGEVSAEQFWDDIGVEMNSKNE
jgi:foldase protein PrsA